MNYKDEKEKADNARAWPAGKSPVKDKRISCVTVYSFEVRVYHGDPAKWAK